MIKKPQKQALTPQGGAIKAGVDVGYALCCRTCLRAIPAETLCQTYCSMPCRLLGEALDDLLVEVRSGRAEGLRTEIGELAGEVKRERLSSGD